MTVQAIAPVRRLVWEMLRGSPVPVFRYLPGSADDLPSIVVGRPDGTTDPDTSALLALTVPVFALGRTERDDDAQAELDDLGDLLLGRFWAPPPTEGVHLRLDDLTAGTVEVGGVTVPAYTAAVSARLSFCP
jgi:hypothetical protein